MKLDEVMVVLDPLVDSNNKLKNELNVLMLWEKINTQFG
jgi:hypothetical protein